MKKRILLIGIDGGSWKIFDPLMERGAMPTLKRLSKEGFRSNLISTNPPLTAPAWTSLMTGKFPEKHGIFDFFKFDRERKSVYIVNSSYIQAETLWEILSRHGKKVASLFFPYTYPPYKVNGIIVSGFDTPSMESNFTYPPELKEGILNEFPELDITVGKLMRLLTTPQKKEDALNEAFKSIENKLKTTLYLIGKSEDIDLIGVQIQETDIIQHILWGDVEKMVEGERERFVSKLEDFYSLVDNFLKVLIEKSSPHEIFVASDHGFTKLKRIIYPNYFLFKENLVDMKFHYKILWKMRQSGRLGNILANVAKNIRHKIINLIKGIGKKSAIEEVLFPHIHDTLRRINWGRTNAFVAFGQFGGWGYIFGEDEGEIRRRLEGIKENCKEFIKDITFFEDSLWREDYPDFMIEPYEGDILSPSLWVEPFLHLLKFQTPILKMGYLSPPSHRYRKERFL